jgi:subtilase family serine protease
MLAERITIALIALAATARASASPPAIARDLGPADPTQTITLTVHLSLPNQPAFDQAVDALTQKSSPTYHQWMTDADLARYAPTRETISRVRAELERNNLTIISADTNGFTLRARGTIENAARAFNTTIHNFTLNGETFRANTTEAHLSGEATNLVTSVAGLVSHKIHPMLARAQTQATPASPAIPLAAVSAAGDLGAFLTDRALSAAETVTFVTPNTVLPLSSYKGQVYDANSNLAVSFTPAQLQTAYNLRAAHSQGLNGRGQTIVLLEAYGYPTNLADANAFSAVTGLSPLTQDKTFTELFPQGAPNPNLGIETGWNTEIALDTEWAHATAPGAKIIVVATNGQDSEDFQDSMSYIIDHNLANQVSDSWEEDIDVLAGPDEQKSYEDILQRAAAKGISFQFATGDSGDSGIGAPRGAPGVPSVEPHATAVGGTALLNKPGTSMFTHVGWGDNYTVLYNGGVVTAPEGVFTGLGGGGGGSIYWKKPSWQANISGASRRTPDISALADPFTGVPIVITSGTQQVLEAGWGGTSLATPIISGIWAIANQKAGKPLGQAAPLIAGLTTGLTDVVPFEPHADVAGAIITSTGKTKYTPQQLLAGADPRHQPFPDALNLTASGITIALAFSLDGSLTVTKGFDDATGYGTPADALAFIDAITAEAAN